VKLLRRRRRRRRKRKKRRRILICLEVVSLEMMTMTGKQDTPFKVMKAL